MIEVPDHVYVFYAYRLYFADKDIHMIRYVCHKIENIRLFLIYINDLPLNIQGAKLILYADDTNGLVVDKNEEAVQTKLSLVMKQLEIWFLKNDLIINNTKTVAMSLHLCCSEEEEIRKLIICLK